MGVSTVLTPSVEDAVVYTSGFFTIYWCIFMFGYVLTFAIDYDKWAHLDSVLFSVVVQSCLSAKQSFKTKHAHVFLCV